MRISDCKAGFPFCRLLLLCSFFLLLLPAYAQQGLVTVTGKVELGSTGTELSGTTVQVKGGKAVTTDDKGRYSIRAAAGSILVFSRIGYKTVELKLKDQYVLDLSLEPTDNNLNQIVVVSYGKQRQRDITGAVSKVDAGSLQDIPAAEFGQKLQSKVAGLQMNQTSGLPGQGMTFRVRGAASLSSGNQPLIVIDGQPITSDIGGDVALIDPNQIESYTVLKDASATSLYGSRAANGVIIITTKQAKLGRTAVAVNAYYGWQQVPKRGRPDLMNAHEFASFMKGYYEDKIKYEHWVNPVTNTPAVPADYANPDQYGKGTDWYDALFRTAPMQNYSVNLSSGTEKLSSSTTFSYFDQRGVLVNTGVRRYAVRSNNEYRPVDRVRIGLNLAPTYQVDYNTRGGSLGINGNRQVIGGAEISSPLLSPYNTDGSYRLNTSSYGMYALPNFLQQANLMNNKQTNLNLLGNAYIDVEIIKGLHLKTTINADLNTQDYNAYYGTRYGSFGSPPPRPPASSSAVNNSNNAYSWLNENTLDYNTRIGDHSIEAMVGYTSQKASQNFRTVSGTGFANDAVTWISGASVTTGTTNNTAWSVASALARVNYDYKKRYYLSATIRNDGSSRFGEFKKYATFPSVSGAWVLSDEPFFPKSKLVSFIKLRGGYGVTGNFNVGNYTQVSLLSPANYVFSGSTTLGEAITSLGNKELTWETSKQTDLGIDINLFKDRVTLSYDYYKKRTQNMLSTLPIPLASGYSTIQYNVAEFNIWGHEFVLSTKNFTGNFTWSTDFNISFNDNRVMKLVNHTPLGGTSKYNDYNRTAEGHHIGELYGYIFDGLYMNAADYARYPKESTSAIGTARMHDVNGDDTITIADRTFIGNPNPKYIFGISNTFAYKNFDLSIVAGGQVGNKIMNINLQNLQNLDGIFNINKDMANRWRSESDPGNGKVPRTLSNTTELYRTTNTNWVFSGDFLAVRNIALGYTFRQKALKYIKSMRVYASVQNAFMFTRYPGQNPEVNDSKDSQTTAGLDNGSFPVPRTVMIGANINF